MPMLCTQHTGLSTSMKVLVLDCVNSPLMKFGTLPPWPFTASQLIPRVCAWAPRHASACHNHNAGSASGELRVGGERVLPPGWQIETVALTLATSQGASGRPRVVCRSMLCRSIAHTRG